MSAELLTSWLQHIQRAHRAVWHRHLVGFLQDVELLARLSRAEAPQEEVVSREELESPHFKPDIWPS